HEGPGVKRDVPPIERPLIEDVARRAIQDGQSVTSVFRGPRDVILFHAAPVVVDGTAVGSAWGMQRLAGLRTGPSTSVSVPHKTPGDDVERAQIPGRRHVLLARS